MSQKTLNDNFSFFTPIQLEKGKSEAGVTVMKMKGIASTNSKDEDGEVLDPNGFDLSYFMKSGYMNWNHQTNQNPLAIIGRPTKSSIENGQMKLECELFDYNPLAKDVYKLGEVLQKSGGGLGFSIEGKVVERDEKDPTKVLKAKITGCAITANPKNKDSVAEIVKGYDGNDLTLIKSMYSAYDNKSEDEKEKAMSTQSAAAIVPESLEKEDKDLTSKKKKKKLFSKSEVIFKLTKAFPDNTGRQIGDIFKIIEQVQKSINMENSEVKVSQESISKALEILGISGVTETKPTDSNSVADSNENLEKGENFLSVEGEKYIMKGDHFEKDGKEFILQKGKMVGKVSEEDKEDEDEDEAEKGKKDKAEKGKKDEVKKSVVVGTSTGNQNDLLGQISDIIKGEYGSLKKAQDSKFKAVAELTKGLMDQVQELNTRLVEVESTPNPQKSITSSSYVEKSFKSANPITDQKTDNTPTLSVSNNKAEILKSLDKIVEGTEGGYGSNSQLVKSVVSYESTGNVDNTLIKAMQNIGIKLVK